MITNYDELIKTIQSVDFGNTLFKVEMSGGTVQFIPGEFPGKEIQCQPKWLESNINWAMARSFDKELKAWKLKDNVIEKVQKAIAEEVLTVIRKCSDAKDATRTALYKEYKSFNDKYSSNAEYYSDMISIINYYYLSMTDTKCKSNVIGLLNILRKKYGAAKRLDS